MSHHPLLPRARSRALGALLTGATLAGLVVAAPSAPAAASPGTPEPTEVHLSCDAYAEAGYPISCTVVVDHVGEDDGTTPVTGTIELAGSGVHNEVFGNGCTLTPSTSPDGDTDAGSCTISVIAETPADLDLTATYVPADPTAHEASVATGCIPVAPNVAGPRVYGVDRILQGGSFSMTLGGEPFSVHGYTFAPYVDGTFMGTNISLLVTAEIDGIDGTFAVPIQDALDEDGHWTWTPDASDTPSGRYSVRYAQSRGPIAANPDGTADLSNVTWSGPEVTVDLTVAAPAPAPAAASRLAATTARSMAPQASSTKRSTKRSTTRSTRATKAATKAATKGAATRSTTASATRAPASASATSGYVTTTDPDALPLIDHVAVEGDRLPALKAAAERDLSTVGAISRLYATALGRQPSAAELRTARRVLGGRPSAASATSLLAPLGREVDRSYPASLSDAEVVRLAFGRALDRQPTRSELAIWTVLLGGRRPVVSRDAFLVTLATSPEAQARWDARDRVLTAYADLSGGATLPTPAVLAFQVSTLERGATRAEMIENVALKLAPAAWWNAGRVVVG